MVLNISRQKKGEVKSTQTVDKYSQTPYVPLLRVPLGEPWVPLPGPTCKIPLHSTDCLLAIVFCLCSFSFQCHGVLVKTFGLVWERNWFFLLCSIQNNQRQLNSKASGLNQYKPNCHVSIFSDNHCTP